jgi:hypothetical protein
MDNDGLVKRTSCQMLRSIEYEVTLNVFNYVQSNIPPPEISCIANESAEGSAISNSSSCVYEIVLSV